MRFIAVSIIVKLTTFFSPTHMCLWHGQEGNLQMGSSGCIHAHATLKDWSFCIVLVLSLIVHFPLSLRIFRNACTSKQYRTWWLNLMLWTIIITPDLDFAGMFMLCGAFLLTSPNCGRSFLCSYEHRFKHHCKLLYEHYNTWQFYLPTTKFTDSIVEVGSCGDVCLKADTTAVVFMSTNAVITCATCRYGKTTCQHVQKLYQILNDHDNDDTTPEVLLPYADAYNRLQTETHTPKKKYPILKYISTEKTPFDLPPHLCSIISKQSSARFNVVDGVALLHPHLSLVCCGCGLSNWIKDVATSAKIVTLNSFIPATGIVNAQSNDCMFEYV